MTLYVNARTLVQRLKMAVRCWLSVVISALDSLTRRPSLEGRACLSCATGARLDMVMFGLVPLEENPALACAM